MPNWCVGVLKIRGNIKNVEHWLKEKINVYSSKFENKEYCMYLDTDKPVKVKVYDDEIYIDVQKEAYIENTKRNFLLVGSYNGSEKNGIMQLALDVKAAWYFQSEPFEKMSKDYGLDFRFYGFERGTEFNQEVIIEGGELKADNNITYNDYFWECPFPELGG